MMIQELSRQQTEDAVAFAAPPPPAEDALFRKMCFDFPEITDDSLNLLVTATNTHIDKVGSAGTASVAAKSAFDTVMLKVVRKINSPGFCRTIEIINQPSPNTSPFVGSSIFNVIPDKLYNDHYAWTNGVETLSFIPTDSNDVGNWLIGNEPGVDNGYVYLSTNGASMTPLNLEGSATEPDFQWKWLLDLKWAPQPAMRVVCKDVYKPGPFYYEVEYFDQHTREAVRSALVPDLNPYILSLYNQLNKSFNLATFLASEANLQIPFPAYYERSTGRWRLLEGMAVVAEFGSPVYITRAKQATGTQESHVAVLVNRLPPLDEEAEAQAQQPD